VPIVVEILPGVASGLIAAFFAARWSVKKFYKEKWWERKEQAYVEIINSLYDVVQYLEIMKEDYGQGTGYSKESESELRQKYSSGYWNIKKATDVGAFVISDKAQKVLIDLKERPKLNWREEPSWEIYESDYLAYRETLDKIVVLAKADLGAKNA